MGASQSVPSGQKAIARMDLSLDNSTEWDASKDVAVPVVSKRV